MGRPGRVRSVRGSAGAASSRAKVSRPGRSPQAGAEGGPREGPRVPLSPPEGRVRVRESPVLVVRLAPILEGLGRCLDTRVHR